MPPNTPRPLLQGKLGINYRRIPILAIGRNIYIDTHIMSRKLETGLLEGRLRAQGSFGAALEDTLEEYIIDGGPFWRTSTFDFTCHAGSYLAQRSIRWSRRTLHGRGLKINRAWSDSQVKLYFAMLEKVLADGQE